MKSYIPDYPRPQMVRENWENLNGQWNFAFDDENIGLNSLWSAELPCQKEITVPYTYETKLSGIGDETIHERVWYGRKIQVDNDKLSNNRLILHFEGSDYFTSVWVNGVYIGCHTGGYARFSFDITDAVVTGANRLVVMAEDSLDPCQPRGKQRWLPENFGCWYVQTTGIWKTVWMEYVPQIRIASIKLTPDLSKNTLTLECDIHGVKLGKNLTLEAAASYQGKFIGRVTIPATKPHLRTELDVYSMDAEWGVRTWSPEEPNLYDLEVLLLEDGCLTDRVLSYFGMREIRIDGQNILLNGHPLYQRLILDQGYWRDSHLTPPGEAALIEDIDKIMQLGYNGVRKHQKIEDERFLYWCDVKGLMVWCEMPSSYSFGDSAVDAFIVQWSEVIRQNYNHPCIITWTPFNESWGIRNVKTDRTQQHFTEAVYHLTKSFDPYRPVIVNDGWEHTVSDILTLHDYEEQGSVLFERYTLYKDALLNGSLYHSLQNAALAHGFAYRGQPVIISEFGGISYSGDESKWGYGNKVNTEEEFIARFDSITTAIKKLPYCCGFCYTQVTDVQQESNGLMDIDRNFKVDPKRIHAINTASVSCCHY